MIRKAGEIKPEIKENLRGGKGAVQIGNCFLKMKWEVRRDFALGLRLIRAVLSGCMTMWMKKKYITF